MLQTRLIYGIGALTLLLGAVANFRSYGLLISGAYLIIMGIVIYLAAYQITCVIYGRCTFTSWWNTILAMATFAGIALYYFENLRGGLKLPTLEKQGILRENRTFDVLNKYANDHLGINVLEYVHNGAVKSQ